MWEGEEGYPTINFILATFVHPFSKFIIFAKLIVRLYVMHAKLRNFPIATRGVENLNIATDELNLKKDTKNSPSNH
jgi:hypothetical protein